MTASEFVTSQLAWAKRKKRKDGTIEEIIGFHIKRPTDELVKKIKDSKFMQIYKRVRNPDKKEDIENKVEKRYNGGKYNPEIPGIVVSTLHQESNEDIGAYKRYSSKDKDAGIGFIANSCNGAIRYSPFISQLPGTGLEDILSEIDSSTYREYEDEDVQETEIDYNKTSLINERKELERKLNMISNKIGAQEEKYKDKISRKAEEELKKKLEGMYEEEKMLEKELNVISKEIGKQEKKSQSKISRKAKKELEKKLGRIYMEIDKQDKKYTFNFALHLQIEADNWDSANQIKEYLASFIKEKAIVESELKPVRCEDKNKIRAVYFLHIQDPKKYDLSESIAENADGLIDMQVNEIIKRKKYDKPGKDELRLKEKLSDIYKKKYWWKFWTIPTILRTKARNRLMEDIKMGTLGWIYTGIINRLMEKTVSEDINYNEIRGNPYLSTAFFGSKIKGMLKIMPWYQSLKDEMPNWEWLDLGKEHKSELEKDLEEQGTEIWLDYLNRQKYLGTQVIGIRYKNKKDRNTVLKSYSLLPSLFEAKNK